MLIFSSVCYLGFIPHVLIITLFSPYCLISISLLSLHHFNIDMPLLLEGNWSWSYGMKCTKSQYKTVCFIRKSMCLHFETRKILLTLLSVGNALIEEKKKQKLSEWVYICTTWLLLLLLPYLLYNQWFV